MVNKENTMYVVEQIEPQSLKIRDIIPNSFILIPGVGTQEVN